MPNGFKNLSPERCREIRSKGGRAATGHSKGGKTTNARGHNKNLWSPEEARKFGAIGLAMRRHYKANP